MEFGSDIDVGSKIKEEWNVHYIYADAGLKGKTSSHGYLIFDEDFNFICGKGKNSNCAETYIAEKHSIKMAVNRARALGIKDVVVFTDCVSCTLGKDEELLRLSDQINIKFKWIPRENNKLADLLSRLGSEKFFSKMQNVLEYEIRSKDIVKPDELFPNDISIENLTSEQRKEIEVFLFDITKGDSCLDEFFKWAKGRLSSNTYNGRKYLAKQFVEYKYLTSDKEKQHLNSLYDKETLLIEYINFSLHENAYLKYKKVTKKNKKIDAELAKRKLFRNMKLSNTLNSLSNGEIEYRYGCLSIKVKDNQVIDVNKLKPKESKWKVSEFAYNELNSILSIG